MTVTLLVPCYIGGVERDVGYQYTGTAEVEADMVYRKIATLNPVDDSMVPGTDTVNWRDVSLARQRKSTIAEFLTAAGMSPALPLWDDLTFAASGVNLPGAPADATRDQTTGLLSFAGTLDNVIAGSAQMPHAWKTGSIIRPHIHLRFPTAASGKNTRWKFEYDVANINGTFTHDYGTYTTLATITVANPNSARKSVVASFGDLDMTGFGISACIAWRISRLANSDAVDDDTNAVILTDFDIHYQRDSLGSQAEFTKT